LPGDAFSFFATSALVGKSGEESFLLSSTISSTTASSVSSLSNTFESFESASFLADSSSSCFCFSGSSSFFLFSSASWNMISTSSKITFSGHAFYIIIRNFFLSGCTFYVWALAHLKIGYFIWTCCGYKVIKDHYLW
jgi:hypothetical protein